MSNLTQNTSYPSAGEIPCLGLTEFIILELIWVLYCCTGSWDTNQGLRVLSFFGGIIHVTVETLGRGKLVITTSWFATFWLGRLKISSSPLGIARLVIFLSWLLTDTAAIWVEPVYWWNVLLESLVMVGLVSYQFTQITGERRRKKAGWKSKMAWLCIWGPGWVTLNGLCLRGYTSSMPLIIWYVFYGLLFPVKPKKEDNRRGASGQPTRAFQSELYHQYEEMRHYPA